LAPLVDLDDDSAYRDGESEKYNCLDDHLFDPAIKRIIIRLTMRDGQPKVEAIRLTVTVAVLPAAVRTQTLRNSGAAQSWTTNQDAAAERIASANGIALRIRSGTNPDNRHRHRQAGGEGAYNCEGERGKQICLRAQLVYRHVTYSTTR
jgi:hypothetical protein